MEAIGSASAILGLVGGADTAVRTFVTFIKGVKIVDSTISTVLREVQTHLTLIRAVIQRMDEVPAALKEVGDLKRLWGPMEETLRECGKTIEQLIRLFRKFNRESSGLVQAAIKHLRLRFQEEEITRLRERIASLQRNFHTALAAMNVFLAIDRRMNPKKIESCLSDFEEKYDSHKDFLTQQGANKADTSNPQPDMKEIQEKMLSAARPLVASATRSLDRLSNTNSQLSSRYEGTEFAGNICEWRERVPFGEVPSTMPDLEPIDLISWPPDTTTARPLGVTSPESIEVRLILIQRGIAAYYQSSYDSATGHFKEAYDIGPVGMISSRSDGFTDDTLKAWLWLSEIRVNSRRIKSFNTRACSGLTEPKVNLTAIKVESTLRICVDACVLSLAFMYRGDVELAIALCEAALTGISRLTGTSSDEYAEAILVMTEVQYSKGPTESAKVWCSRLSNYQRVFHDRAVQFIWPGREYLRKGLGTLQIGIFNEIRDQFMRKCPGNDVTLDAMARLCRAIEHGNFGAALYLIHTCQAIGIDPKVQKPKVCGHDIVGSVYRGDQFLVAMKSDSVSIVSLLIQYWADMDATPVSRLVDFALPKAIQGDFKRAVEMLINAGASKEDSCLRLTGRPSEEACYAIRNTTISPLSDAIRRGHVETIEVLLAKGFPVNGPSRISEGLRTYHVEPSLHVAIRCFKGRQLVPLLLEHGANVNFSFKDVSPLALAIYKSEMPKGNGTVGGAAIVPRQLVVEQLIGRGADVNKRSHIDGKWVTPLQQAKSQKLASIEKLLIDSGAKEIVQKKGAAAERATERRGRKHGR